MTAPYVKLLRSIWANDDFKALNANPQRTFMMLFSQPNLSACGGLVMTQRRWANLASDTDADSVQSDLNALELSKFVVSDYNTEEVWVRSYMRIDEMFLSPNGRKAIDKAIGQVLSNPLRERVVNAFEALCAGAPEEGNEGASKGDSSPQQPSAFSREPAAAAGPLAAAAAAAVELVINHRLNTEDVRNRTRYANRLRGDLPREHGMAMRQYLTDHQDATAQQIAKDVLGLTDIDIARARSAS